MEKLKDKNENKIAKVSGRKIKQLREKHHLSQAQLAEILECSVQSLGKVERGLQTMKYWRMVRLCEVFHVSLDYIVRDFDPSDVSSVPSYLVKLYNDADMMELEILSDHVQLAGKLIDLMHDRDHKKEERKVET